GGRPRLRPRSRRGEALEARAAGAHADALRRAQRRGLVPLEKIEVARLDGGGAAEKLGPHFSGLRREDRVWIRSRYMPIAASDFGLELGGRPARVAGED